MNRGVDEMGRPAAADSDHFDRSPSQVDTDREGRPVKFHRLLKILHVRRTIRRFPVVSPAAIPQVVIPSKPWTRSGTRRLTVSMEAEVPGALVRAPRWVVYFAEDQDRGSITNGAVGATMADGRPGKKIEGS